MDKLNFFIFFKSLGPLVVLYTGSILHGLILEQNQDDILHMAEISQCRCEPLTSRHWQSLKLKEFS